MSDLDGLAIVQVQRRWRLCLVTTGFFMSLKRLGFVVHALCAFGATQVQAQAVFGDLMDAGATKLSSAEVRALGDLRIVRTAVDADAFMAIRTDGTVVGMVHNKQGSGSSEAIGTWHLATDGQRCVDVDLPAFRMQMKQCGYTYRLGGDIFFAPAGADRNIAITRYAGPAFLQ